MTSFAKRVFDRLATFRDAGAESAWGRGEKPALGAISSSFQTRSEPRPTRVASWQLAKEIWRLALSHPRSSPASWLNGRCSIIGDFRGNSLGLARSYRMDTAMK
jgi:hypothetical protein